MRSLGLLLLLALACGGPDVERLLDLPATVDDARALADPPSVVVEVSRHEVSSGGGACGHAAVCLVLLPIIVWDMVFPEKVDDVVVKAGGVLLTGTYEPDGALLAGERRWAGESHAGRILELPELGRSLLVETGVAPLGADGQPGDYRPTTLQSQVDLVAAYRARAADRGPTDELYGEAFRALREEALPLVADSLGNPAMAAGDRARLLTELCGLDVPTVRAQALGAAVTNPATEVSIVALGCLQDPPGHPLVLPIAARLVEDTCREAREDALDALARSDLAPLRPQARQCADPTRAALLRLAMHDPLPAAALSPLVAVDTPDARLLAGRLDPGDPEHRQALLARLEAIPGDTLGVGLLDELGAQGGSGVAPAEGARLARIAVDARASNPNRAAVLEVLWHAGEKPAGLFSGPPTGDPPLPESAVRLVLGEPGMALAVARHLPAEPRLHTDAWEVEEDGELAAFALWIAGCPASALPAAATRAWAESPGARGPACPTGG